MYRCDLILLAIASTGCNAVFGLDETIATDAAPAIDASAPDPDLDRDGIPDTEDPCIATAIDATQDSDGDAVANDSDDCPFDATLGPDTDQDGIQDACDPFPNLAGDRARCVMALRNPGLNARLWRQRPGDTGWDFSQPQLTGFDRGGTIVATTVLEAPVSTTFDIYLGLSNLVGTATFTLWLRTNDTPMSDDVGCRITGTSTSGELSIVGTSTPISTPIARTVMGSLRLRATVEPTGTGSTVRCKLDYYTPVALDVPVLAAPIVLPAGRTGLTIGEAIASFTGLMIYERAAPGL